MSDKLSKYQGPQPSEPDPQLSTADWMLMLMRCTTHQLDKVRQAWKYQRPEMLTEFEQIIWYAPPELLKEARDALERDKQWRDLPLVKRAAMLQLEAEEKEARRKGEATKSFLVSATLDEEGELDVKLKKVVWRALFHWIFRYWKTWAIPGVVVESIHWLWVHREAVRNIISH